MSHNRDLSTAAAQIGVNNSNVGIGTDVSNNPSGSKLVVGGRIQSNAGGYWFSGANGAEDGWHVQDSGGNLVVVESGVAERLRITSAGNIGIGENSPDRLLHIKGASSTAYSGGSDTADYNFLKIENTTDDKSAGIFFAIGSNGEAAITATEVADGNTDIAFQNRGGGVRSEKLRIKSNGNIGINEDNPQNALHISGSSPTIRFEDTGANGSAFSVIEDNNGLFKIRNDAGNSGTGSGITFEVDAAEALRITSAGDMGLGTASPNHKLTLHNSGTGTFDALNITSGLTNAVGLQFGIDSSSNVFFWHTANGAIKFATNNVERMRVTNGGLDPSTDGVTDLGNSSKRFRDLYLSSGIFLGGTTSSNELEDYEEGTSTVSIQNITADTNQVLMKYTKIGSVVCVVGVITLVNITVSSGSNAWFHLPFAPSHHSTAVPGASIQKNSINTGVAYLGFYGNNTNMYFMSRSGGYTSGNQLSAGQIGFTATYTTH